MGSPAPPMCHPVIAPVTLITLHVWTPLLEQFIQLCVNILQYIWLFCYLIILHLSFYYSITLWFYWSIRLYYTILLYPYFNIILFHISYHSCPIILVIMSVSLHSILLLLYYYIIILLYYYIIILWYYDIIISLYHYFIILL